MSSDEMELIKAVRGLDQESFDNFPLRMGEIWTKLCRHRCGSSFAAEKMLLRLLFKTMNGPAGEQYRRCPETWNVLRLVFSRLPSSSLAQSLLSVRFVDTLGQTLKAISAWSDKSGPGVSRKRKRTGPMAFDLDTQRERSGCLQTAYALFPALDTVLSRCDPKVGKKDDDKMGPRHLRSLFYTTGQNEFRQMLSAMLVLLDSAVTDVDFEDSHGSWTATFVSFWELHPRSGRASLEVVISLSAWCVSILRKANSPSSEKVSIESAVKDQWTRDLRSFLIKNLILPARGAFVVHRGLEDMEMVVGQLGSATANYTVLLDLVLQAPPAIGGTTVKKDSEAWVQAVFDLLEKELDQKDLSHENGVIHTMLEMAVKHSVKLPPKTLRSICEKYALLDGRIDWGILLCIIDLDTDVFLRPQNGLNILDDVLRLTRNTGELEEQESPKVVQFLVSLANGFAAGRNFFGFLKIWLEKLELQELHLHEDSPRNVWSQPDIITTVAANLQTSINVGQLRSILDWLESQETDAQKTASILVMEAIAKGLKSDEYVDAVNMRLFSLAFAAKLPTTTSVKVLATRWAVAELTLGWTKLDEREQVWARVEADLKRTLETSPLVCQNCFAAFKCASTAWLSQYPGGKYEEDAAATVCAFMERLCGADKGLENEAQARYASWIVHGTSRLLSLAQKRNPSIVLDLGVFKVSPETESQPSTRHTDSSSFSFDSPRELLRNETNINNFKLTSMLVEEMIELALRRDGPSKSYEVAVETLLEVPCQFLHNELRSTIALPLFNRLLSEHTMSFRCLKSSLGLYIRVMEKPTFYDENMNFRDLDTIACHLTTKVSGREWTETDLLGAQEAMQLLGELALLITRNLTKRGTRFLSDAVQRFQTGEWTTKTSTLPRLVVLKSLVKHLSLASDTCLPDAKFLQTVLAEKSRDYMLKFQEAWKNKSDKTTAKPLLSLLTALEALDVLDSKLVSEHVSAYVVDLLAASDRFVALDLKAGWQIRTFLAKHFRESLSSPLDLFQIASPAEGHEAGHDVHQPPKVDRNTVVSYFDTVIGSIDEGARLHHLQQLLSPGQEKGPQQLLVNHLLIQQIKDVRRQPANGPDGQDFDLATAHSMLCKKLLEPKTQDEFVLVAQTIHLLVAQKPDSMDQWNVELTLSNVAVVSCTMETGHLNSPRVFRWLCQLVRAVMTRHRKRLYGRFHLLVSTLQALLRCLIAHPAFWDKHARTYTRLILLMCEPVTTVMAKGDRLALDSERDEAKRCAGRHMYMVLMLYVKLLVEHRVPLGVREALEPGIHAILDITTQDGLKIVSDAVDTSGRAILKELYKRYEMFGKWAGV